MKKLYYLYADFETTRVNLPKGYETYKQYYEEHLNPDQPKVYSWSILYDREYKKLGENNFSQGNVFKDEYNYNYDISGNSFIEFIENLKVDALMYFNNLRGFDGHFIVPILDSMGYYNVLPFDIEDYITLSEEQKIVVKNRMIRIKDNLLKIVKIKEKFENLKKISKNKANNYILFLVKKHWGLLFPKEYSLVTNGNSKIYEIKIGIENNKKTKGKVRNRALVIRDNLNLFPSSIKSMGKTILLDYLKVNYQDKGLIDDIDKVQDDYKNLAEWIKDKDVKKYKVLSDAFYKKEISGGYDRTELYKSIEELQNDGNELEYLVQDTYILWKFHKVIEQFFPRNQWKMTIGSTSYKLWQESFGEKIMEMYYNNGTIEDVYLERGAKRIQYQNKLYSTMDFKKKCVKTILPTNWMASRINDYESHYDLLYKYYSGGMTFVNEEHRGQLVSNITFVDINSSYPAQMVKNIWVPVGKGLLGDVKSHEFKFYKLTPKKNIYNKTGLPFLHNEFADKREYLKTLRPNTQYRFTSITLSRFLEYYKCDPDDYELEIEYSFMQMKIGDIFGDFIERWYAIKENSAKDGNAILKFIAKLFMNNVYGKLATKIKRDSKIWNQDMTSWESYIQDLEPEFYLPLGIAITELGRMQLVDGVGHNYDQVVYGDTDSIAIIDYKPEDFPNIELHPSEIGKWDIEFSGGNGIFRRAKQYLLLNDKKHKMAFSGINFDRFLLSDQEIKDLEITEDYYRQVSLKDFIVGKSIDQQLNPFRLLGSGLILEEKEKEINPIWSYEPLTEQKYYLKEHFIDNLEKIKHIKRNHI